MIQVTDIARSSCRRLLTALFVAAMAAIHPLAEAAEEKAQTTERVAIEVGKATEFMKNSDWASAVATLKAVLPTTQRGSYDQAVVSITLAQAILNSDGKAAPMKEAIPAMITAVESGFFDIARSGEWYFLVAYLYYQENDIVSATKWAKRYLTLVPKVAPERIVFYASLALTDLDAAAANPALVEDVLQEIERGLHETLRPPENLYLLKAVAYQALGRLDAAAEMLELSVHLFPDKAQFWSQLLGLYASTGQDLRAALTIERAQSRGLMKTPRENGGLVSLYFNLGRYNQVIELLEKGLAEGSIEPVERNFETLAYAYQFAHREELTISVYERAAKLFGGGKYYALIANQYFNLGNQKKALENAKIAVEKGGIDKPAQFIMFTAFLAYEEKDYVLAGEFLDKALPLVSGDREQSDFRNLRGAVDRALQARAAEEEAAKEEAAAVTAGGSKG